MTPTTRSVTVAIAGLQRILDVLVEDDYDVFGPVVRDGAIVIRPLLSVEDLPLGVTTTAAPGRVELVPRNDRARFGWALPAQSWKPLVHPPRVRTMTMRQSAGEHSVSVAVAGRRPRRQAFLGVRPCELAALERLDTVLVERPPTPDPTYTACRGDAFLVVVNCGSPADTCFCTSMATGPHVEATSVAHDLEVTELVDPVDATAEPRYVVRSISERGRVLVGRLIDDGFASSSTAVDEGGVAAIRDAAIERISRRLDAAVVRDRLADAHDAPAWDEIAETCLACGNCTAVCPTCFCTTIDDIGDLTGRHVDRWRSWESCFSLEFSRLGSHAVRSSLASRYRQWMTHKLSSWHDQFGEGGCVGCGRCTAWCPVGIDFVDEATRLSDRIGVMS
jgi:ferredoxin